MADSAIGRASFLLAADARMGTIIAAHDADDSVSVVLAMTQPRVLPWTPASEVRSRRGCDICEASNRGAESNRRRNVAGVIHRFIETNGIRMHILRVFVPNLTKTVMLPGCGHGTQQERPDEVNTAMIAFLRGL